MESLFIPKSPVETAQALQVWLDEIPNQAQRRFFADYAIGTLEHTADLLGAYLSVSCAKAFGVYPDIPDGYWDFDDLFMQGLSEGFTIFEHDSLANGPFICLELARPNFIINEDSWPTDYRVLAPVLTIEDVSGLPPSSVEES